MSASDALSATALIVALVALVVSAYQAYVGHRDLEASHKALQQSLRSAHLVTLPQANFVIYLRLTLEGWMKKLEEAGKLMQQAMAAEHPHVLAGLSEYALSSPKNLIERSMYELSPEWIQMLLTAGAQHYYTVACNFAAVAAPDEGERGFTLTAMVLERCETSHFYIKQLLAYVDELVPEAYLRKPDSIRDEAFLTS